MATSTLESLILSLLTAEVVQMANGIHAQSQLASVPQLRTRPLADGSMEVINDNPHAAKPWSACLSEAVDQLARNQPEVLRLLKDSGLMPQ